MSNLLHLLFLVLSLAFTIVWSETIVIDSLGNSINLSLAGGNATGSITNINPTNSTSIYTLNVYINNGENNGISSPPLFITGEIETFYFGSPNNNGLWGNATLIRSGYSRTFSAFAVTSNTTANQYLGSTSSPVSTTGLYQFIYSIPVSGFIFVNLTYINSGQPVPLNNLITILVGNPISANLPPITATSSSSSTGSTPSSSSSSTGSIIAPGFVSSGGSDSLDNGGVIAIVVASGLVFTCCCACCFWFFLVGAKRRHDDDKNPNDASISTSAVSQLPPQPVYTQPAPVATMRPVVPPSSHTVNIG